MRCYFSISNIEFALATRINWMKPTNISDLNHLSDDCIWCGFAEIYRDDQ